MTQEEAASLLALNGYKDDVAELIKVCALQKRILAVLASGGLRAGDLAYYSQKIQDGRMTLETVRQAVAKEVREDVRRFGEIEIKDLPGARTSSKPCFLRRGRREARLVQIAPEQE